MMRVGVLASGRGSNLQAIIDAKKDGRLPEAELIVVISDHQDAQALERARKNKIETVFIDPKTWKGNREGYDGEVVKALRERNIELVVMAGFMRILSTVLLEAFPNRIINIHPALLPSFPGLHAQRQAVEHGVKVSGCTVHFVDAGVDTGPIIMQHAVPVMDDDTEDTLSARILEYEHQCFPKVVDMVSRGRVRVKGRKVYVSKEKK